MFSTVSLIDFGYDIKLSIMRTVNSVSNIWMTIGALEKKQKNSHNPNIQTRSWVFAIK